MQPFGSHLPPLSGVPRRRQPPSPPEQRAPGLGGPAGEGAGTGHTNRLGLSSWACADSRRWGQHISSAGQGAGAARPPSGTGDPRLGGGGQRPHAWPQSSLSSSSLVPVSSALRAPVRRSKQHHCLTSAFGSSCFNPGAPHLARLDHLISCAPPASPSLIQFPDGPKPEISDPG